MTTATDTRLADLIASKEYPPTDEQVNFITTVADKFYNRTDFDDGRSVVLATAVAGAGKTATLIDIYNLLAADLQGRYIQLCAFNVKARDEMLARGVEKLHCKTLNGLGHANLARYARNHSKNLVLDDHKVVRLLRVTNPILAEIAPLRRFTRKLIDFAKSECVRKFTRDRLETLAEHYGIFIDLDFETCRADYGKSFDELEELAYEWAIETLKKNNEAPQGRDWVIDYNDQVYLPVVLNLRCFENDLLIVDEAQDLSICDKFLVDRCLKSTGVLVLVGDDYQCIYAWRGCRPGGLEATRTNTKLNVTHTPLTYNWRSGQEIIDVAATICPDIKCGNGKKATVMYVDAEDFEVTGLQGDTAVLSRLRAPLIGHAIECLKIDKPFTFRISLNFLADAVKEAADGKGDLSIRAFKRRWNAYVSTKRAQYELQDADQAVEELNDTDQIMDVLLSRVVTTDKVEALNAEIERLQKQINESDGALTLSTMHGAKGLEWGTTYLLGYESIGNGCKREWQQIEARNLRFVAVTRAKSELIFVESAE